MILLLLVCVGVASAGFALSEWLWQRESLRGEGATPLERTSSWLVLTFAVWTALNWFLAAAHLWRPAWLVGGAVAVGVPGVWGTYNLVRRVQNRQVVSAELRRFGFAAFVLAPIGIWVLFVLVRSTLLPVLPHDGLNYHMPKAVLLIREGGFRWFQTSNLRISSNPFNYELILSAILMLTDSDELTAWPTTFSYVFFLVGSAALAERFWGRGLHVLAAPLLTAAVPIALFHCGAHKQDLLIASLVTVAFVSFGRWTSRGGLTPAVITILAMELATGAKFSGLFVCVVLALLLGVFAIAGQREAFRFTRREWAILAGVVLCEVLLGGIGYGMNLYQSGRITGPPETVLEGGYGQWSNLWMFTVMLLMRPFGSSIHDIYNPWYGNDWWWRKYDLYFSHFGIAFTVLVVALPFAVYRYARLWRGDGRSKERWMTSLPFLLSYIAIVPLRARPLGLFSSFGRFVLFVVPVVFVWTVVPLVRELLEARAWKAWLGRGVLVVCSAVFVANAISAAINDSYAPLGLVRAAVTHDIQLGGLGYTRASIFVDGVAGPDDHVAISGDFDTYLYPVFGHDRRRRISFIPDGPGPAQIPDDATWVIVDRSWAKFWNNPRLVNTNQFRDYFGKGTPTPDDLRVFKQLKKDPHWKLIERDVFANQAVFVRVAPDTVPEAAPPEPAPALAPSP